MLDQGAVIVKVISVCVCVCVPVRASPCVTALGVKHVLVLTVLYRRIVPEHDCGSVAVHTLPLAMLNPKVSC